MLFNRLCALLITLCASVSVTLASGVIVPLYSYPGSSASKCTAWTSLISTIAANPSVTFYVIINPNSGPGKANTQPDAVYAGCTQKLKAANVVLLGYVDTQYGKRASSAVTQDVKTYAGWKSAYSVSGIFYDDVSATASLFAKYTGWAATARQSLNGGSGLVILNPGTGISDNDYFTIADQIMTFEDKYSNFKSSSLKISAASPASKQSVILYSAPAAVPTSTISQLVSADAVGSVYITNLGGSNPYSSIPQNFGTFVSTVAADS